MSSSGSLNQQQLEPIAFNKHPQAHRNVTRSARYLISETLNCSLKHQLKPDVVEEVCFLFPIRYRVINQSSERLSIQLSRLQLAPQHDRQTASTSLPAALSLIQYSLY